MRLTRELIAGICTCDAWPEDRIAERVPEAGLEATALDIVDSDLSAEDTLWLLCELAAELGIGRELRLFAADCAERACNRVNWTDARSLRAIEVAKQYANGDVTQAELRVAWEAANDASLYVARDVPCDDTWDATWAATRAAVLRPEWYAWDAALSSSRAAMANSSAMAAERREQMRVLRALLDGK